MPNTSFPFVCKDMPGLLDVLIGAEEAGILLYRDPEGYIDELPTRADAALPRWVQRGIDMHQHRLFEMLAKPYKMDENNYCIAVKHGEFNDLIKGFVFES